MNGSLQGIGSLNRQLAGLATLAALVLLPWSALADAITWDGGGGDDNWSTAANWGAGTQFDSGDQLTFDGTTRPTPYNDTTGSSVNRMNFAATAGSFTIGGNAITLTGDSTVNATVAQIINLDMAMTATRKFTLSGAGGNLTLNGVFSGAGGLQKGGTAAATLFLNGLNSFSGEFGTVGTTSINTLMNAGSNCSIGTAATFQLGVSGSGSIYYTGPATSTDRQVKIGSTTATSTGGGTLLNNSTNNGAMTFTHATFNLKSA
jgi:hypothetical protein